MSDSKLPFAEQEIEKEISKKQKRRVHHQHQSSAISSDAGNNNKRDSRTGEAIGSKMCREHPERCNVRHLECVLGIDRVGTARVRYIKNTVTLAKWM